MPRPNKERTIGAEDRLASRMKIEREARGWSLAELAEAMSDAGCPTHASAIHKIERGNPRRRITVNEAAALSAVWAIPLDRLLQ